MRRICHRLFSKSNQVMDVTLHNYWLRTKITKSLTSQSQNGFEILSWGTEWGGGGHPSILNTKKVYLTVSVETVDNLTFDDWQPTQTDSNENGNDQSSYYYPLSVFGLFRKRINKECRTICYRFTKLLWPTHGQEAKKSQYGLGWKMSQQ